MVLPGNVSVIAPCGMNCGICSAYLREKNRCPGCRGEDEKKPKSCRNCAMKTCEELIRNNLDYCFSCAKYPCNRVQHIDKRYRTRYAMSMIENLENIRTLGVQEFLKNEKIRWACPACGGTVCVHSGKCPSCGETKK